MNLLEFSEIELRVCYINQTKYGISKLKKILAEWQTFHNAIKEFLRGATSLLIDFKNFKPEKKHLNNINRFLNSNGYILIPEDTNFPTQLKNSKYCPPILYWQGRPPQPHNSHISIVGTRQADIPAISFTHQITQELANLGYCITSGMACGIDQAAHQCCLDFDHPTFAVLGQGLLFNNPDIHCTSIFEKIKKTGALLSPFPLHTPPTRNTFPQRNRIISGISKATVLIQSKERGGSIITANLCISEKKPLFVMPDHPLKKLSKGGLKLILEGANLALSGKQIQNTLLWQTNTGNQKPTLPKEPTKTTKNYQTQQPTKLNDLFKESYTLQFNTQKQTLIKLLSMPKTLEELISLTSFPTDILFKELCELEITNIVKRDSSMNYQIKV